MDADKGVKCLVSQFEKSKLFCAEKSSQPATKLDSNCSISINICVHKENETEQVKSAPQTAPTSPDVIYDVPKTLHIPKNNLFCTCLRKSRSLGAVCDTCTKNTPPKIPKKYKSKINCSLPGKTEIAQGNVSNSSTLEKLNNKVDKSGENKIVKCKDLELTLNKLLLEQHNSKVLNTDEHHEKNQRNDKQMHNVPVPTSVASKKPIDIPLFESVDEAIYDRPCAQKNTLPVEYVNFGSSKYINTRMQPNRRVNFLVSQFETSSKPPPKKVIRDKNGDSTCSININICVGENNGVCHAKSSNRRVITKTKLISSKNQGKDDDCELDKSCEKNDSDVRIFDSKLTESEKSKPEKIYMNELLAAIKRSKITNFTSNRDCQYYDIHRNKNGPKLYQSPEYLIYDEPDDYGYSLQPTNVNRRLKNVIDELINTEKTYIEKLYKVLNDYQKYIREKEAPIIGKEEIFSNLAEIYQESKSFCESLVRCNYDYEQIAKIFIFFETILFSLYPVYCKNKPLADRAIQLDNKGVLKNRQRELGDPLDLSSYLLMPIQRMGKYILILEAMVKELQKDNAHSENLTLALQIVKEYMAKGNTHLELEDIENFPLDLSITGLFIIKENFYIQKYSKKVQQTLFLFENFILFAKYHPDIEKYVCVEYIETNRVGLTTGDDNKPTFTINYYTDCGDIRTYSLLGTSKRPKHIWTLELQKVLWKQLQQQKEIQRSNTR